KPPINRLLELEAQVTKLLKRIELNKHNSLSELQSKPERRAEKTLKMTSKSGTKLSGCGDVISNSVVNITSNNEDRIYTYAEAINLAGNGWYSVGLLATLSVCTLAMGVDMFGFSVVVSGCTCDFGLDISQTSVLLSMPFVGPIVMAYPWGYISDTQGRRRSLLIAMWISFVVSTIGAFSPNWVVMAVLKFISTMVAYFILNLDFSYDMGMITFTPWRLLALALALPLGLGAFGTLFFYESPKFLVNVQREDEAVENLRKIWKRNNGRGDKYPVKKIILNEIGNERRKDVSLMQSLWEQIVPLFKPPLLWKSTMLYFFTAVIFSTNNSYFIWFPYLAEKFAAGLGSMTHSDETGLCNLIISNNNATAANYECKSTMDISLVWASLAQGVTFVIIMLVITKLAYRKKALMIIIMTFSGLSAVAAALVKDNLASFVMFFGLLTNELCIGIIYTYFVDMYPTSYRGMAACIGVMVARLSALGGVNVLGAFIMTHCNTMFYACGGLMLVAADKNDSNIEMSASKISKLQYSYEEALEITGIIVMSYPWGYLSDTRGRRLVLMWAMSGSFISSAISSLSPSWQVLAALRFISSALSSAAESATYALIGECCGVKVRAKYMLLITSALMITPTLYYITAYLIMKLDFTYYLLGIVYRPWRLLTLIMALPLGLSALLLWYFSESPKFLANVGRNEEAVKVLKRIYVANGHDEDSFPIKQIYLEDGNKEEVGVFSLHSLWVQIAPLFKPPLLWKTALLYYLTFVTYIANNSFAIILPTIFNIFFTSYATSAADASFCDLFHLSNTTTTDVEMEPTTCKNSIEDNTIWAGCAHGMSFFLLNALISQCAGKRKPMTIIILLIAAAAGAGINNTGEAISGLVLFYIFLTTAMVFGVISSYFVDLYPTSYSFLWYTLSPSSREVFQKI
ncbi:hypothetical protein HW555_011662, partial [Spodoptera exigua]